jgi:hypothetical protein
MQNGQERRVLFADTESVCNSTAVYRLRNGIYFKVQAIESCFSSIVVCQVDEIEVVKMGWSQTERKEMCILVHFEYESFWKGDYLTRKISSGDNIKQDFRETECVG